MPRQLNGSKVISEEFGFSKAAAVTQAELEDWLSESELAPRTRKNCLVTLVTLFEWARDRKYVVINPAERIPNRSSMIGLLCVC